MPVTRQIKNFISHLPGWKTRRKILVIESDDWGSIRMPSRKSFDRLRAKGIDVESGDSLRYNLYDTLANEDDLHALFEVLRTHKDSYGNPAVITAMSLSANPDFERIRSDHFDRYHFEPISSTLNRYYPNQNVLASWKQGMNENIFIPQFHGREHLNVMVWMEALKKGDPSTLAAFDEGSWGFTNSHPLNIYYQAAFELADPSELTYHHEVVRTGLELFESIHGYKASFFVPPNGPINNALEATAFEKGIEFISGSKVQLESLGHGKVRKRFHYMGQKSAYGLHYMTRNCFFEPSQSPADCVATCLKEIEMAFRFKNPAVISTHRVNYIGALDEKNRTNSLQSLNELLAKVKQRWPEVEFMSSDTLGKLIKKSS